MKKKDNKKSKDNNKKDYSKKKKNFKGSFTLDVIYDNSSSSQCHKNVLA